MIVRELLTKLSFSADESKVRSFDGAVQGLQKSLLAVVGAATAAGAAAFSLASASARYGDEVAKTARQLGIGGEALQEYRFAFDRLGVSEGEATAGLERFSRALGRAGQGSGAEADAFERLGISIRGSDGRLRDMADLLPEAADGLAAIENEAERAAVAQDLFGRSSGRLAMALAEGGDNISDLREEFRLLGGGLTEDQTKAAEEFTDAMTNMRTVLNGIRLQIGAELMPVFRPMIEAITQFIALNREIILTRAHDFFQMLSDAMRNLMAVAERVIGVIGRVVEAVSGMDNATQAALAVVALWLAWRRLGRFFVAAGIVAILNEIGKWMEGQPSLIDKLLPPYEEFAEAISNVVEAIGGLESIIRVIIGLALARWLLKVAGAAKAVAVSLGFGGAVAAAGASGAAAGRAWRMAFIASAAAGLARGLVRRLPVIGAASFGMFGGIDPADQTAQALVGDQLAASGLEPGSPEWQTLRDDLISGLGPITAEDMDVFETEMPAWQRHRMQHPDIDASNLLGEDFMPPPREGAGAHVPIGSVVDADALARSFGWAPSEPSGLGEIADEIREYFRDLETDAGGDDDSGTSRAIRELQDLIGGLEEMSFDLNAPPELETLSGDIDNSVTNTRLDFNVTQNITVPPGTTAEQLAVIRAETRRTLEREVDSAARALET